MKQNSTPFMRLLKASVTVFITVVLMLLFKSASAHTVIYFAPPCFTQGSTVTVGVKVAFAAPGSYYHWQYRTAPGAAWSWLSNGNNTINGRTFSVAGASQTSAVADYTPNLVIGNVGSPAYTTQLDNIELRVIMTNGLDPQTHPFPGTAAWGAEEFNNAYEAKYIRLISKPATENCYSNCTGNVLVVNPAAVPPPMADYYGGFETGTGSLDDNFSTLGNNGTTARAATDITKWAGGTLGTASRYRVMSNPDSMNTAFSAFAPHSGNQMMIVSRNNSVTNRLWYRTIAVNNASSFYNGQVILKAWFAKVDANDAAMVLEVKGSTTQGGTVSSFGGNSVNQSITGTAGNWIQVTLNINLPQNTYKKLEFSIHSANAAVASVAIDDICLLEPQGSTLPVIMTPLHGAYAEGVAHLAWTTEQESNSDYFEIEHSTNGTDFTSAGKVYANGFSGRTISYKFDDVKAAAGANYYRLRMVDKNGYFEYSNTVLVNVTIKGLFVTGVYPSPFTDKVNISISSENASEGNVRFYDLTGRVLATQNVKINKGVTTITLNNLGNLAKGMYVAEVNCAGAKYTERVIK